MEAKSFTENPFGFSADTKALTKKKLNSSGKEPGSATGLRRVSANGKKSVRAKIERKLMREEIGAKIDTC